MKRILLLSPGEKRRQNLLKGERIANAKTRIPKERNGKEEMKRKKRKK